MAMRLLWTQTALDDLERIADYIGKDSPRYAKVVVEKFFENSEFLRNFPRMGRVVPEYGDPTIRELVVHQYRLIYRFDDEKIDILTVVHSRRQLD